VTWHVNQTYLLGSLLPLYVYRDIGSYSRRFTGAGAPIGSQIKLNTFDPGWQYEPTIAVTSSGGYVVGWMSAPIDSHMDPPSPPPQDGSGAGVYARLFDAGGNDIGGGEFQLHATPAGNQFNPALAATAGGFVAAFESVDASGVGVFARLFGTALTPAAFEVDPTDEPQSDGNRVFENGETVVVAPAWRNAIANCWRRMRWSSSTDPSMPPGGRRWSSATAASRRRR